MFTDQDLKNHQAFARVLDEAKFDIEGKAVIPAAMLIRWYVDLGAKIKDAIDRNSRPMLEPIKTCGLTKPKGKKK